MRTIDSSFFDQNNKEVLHQLSEDEKHDTFNSENEEAEVSSEGTEKSNAEDNQSKKSPVKNGGSGHVSSD